MNKVALRLKTSAVGVTVAATALGVGGIAVVSRAIANQIVVASTTVNLRTGPGMTYDIVQEVPEGSTLSASGTDGNWTKVSFNGATGYVWSNYVSANAGGEPGNLPVGKGYTAITHTTVNVRSGPGTSFPVVEHLEGGTAVKLTGVRDGSWAQIVWDGVRRWIWADYATQQGVPLEPAKDTFGQVRTTDVVNLRVKGVYGAAIMGQLPANSLVDVTGETTESYTQILFQGQLLWIYSAYTAPVRSGMTTAESLAATVAHDQAAVVAYAKSKTDGSYVWSGEGPAGFDASGLAMRAYEQVGIELPHHVADQATLGLPVGQSALQPGDLIFWNSPVSHVSIYVGNGQMVHARNVDAGIVQQSVQSYLDTGAFYAGGRRLVTS